MIRKFTTYQINVNISQVINFLIFGDILDTPGPFYPVIGIFGVGISVLNLTVRDDEIGWTVDAIKRNMNIQTNTTSCENTVSGTLGKKYLLA